jgi:hypothetical protein
VTLEWLYLRDGKISDAGLKYVKMLPNLEQLGLDGTDITEEGLAGLKGMQKLKHLQIRDTCIGQSEANRVHKALPNCFIRYGSRKGGSPKPIEPKGVTVGVSDGSRMKSSLAEGLMHRSLGQRPRSEDVRPSLAEGHIHQNGTADE